MLAFLGLSFSGQWVCEVVFFFVKHDDRTETWIGSCIHQLNQCKNNGGGLVTLIKDWPK